MIRVIRGGEEILLPNRVAEKLVHKGMVSYAPYPAEDKSVDDEELEELIEDKVQELFEVVEEPEEVKEEPKTGLLKPIEKDRPVSKKAEPKKTKRAVKPKITRKRK